MDPKKEKALEAEWNKKAQQLLINRTIVCVSYMTKAEAKQCGWDTRPLIITLSNGVSLYASSDDEGNNAGALFTTSNEEPCFPVLYW